MELVADRFHVIAADLYGRGKSPAWPEERHSYGGAIALKAAKYGDRVRSLVPYEPVLFALLVRAAPQSAAAREIIAVRDDTMNRDPAAAAQRFIDAWCRSRSRSASTRSSSASCYRRNPPGPW
jgi:pimeloyl-ACP methyl ester carboxylesterase